MWSWSVNITAVTEFIDAMKTSVRNKAKKGRYTFEMYLIGKKIVALKIVGLIFSRSKFQSLANNNNRKQRDLSDDVGFNFKYI